MKWWSFVFGLTSTSLFIEVLTHYGWASKNWNDWVSISFSLFGACTSGLLLFFDAFSIERRTA